MYVCPQVYIPVHLEGMHVVCMSSCIQASCLDEWPPIEEPERCEQGPHRKGPARNPKLTAVSTKSRTLQSLWNSIPGVPSVLCGTVRTSVATKAAPAEDSLRRCGRCGTAGCFSTMHLHVSCSQASIILPILFSCPFAAHTPEHHGADNKKNKTTKNRHSIQHPPQPNQTMTMAYNDKSTKTQQTALWRPLFNELCFDTGKAGR